MILYNKQKIQKILYNKQKISKILMNKRVIFNSDLTPLDLEGHIGLTLPDIPGISDYFIFILTTHYPITKRSNTIVQYISDLCNLKVLNPVSGIDYDVVRFNNFEIGTSFGNIISNKVDGEVITGDDDLDDTSEVNSNTFFNFRYSQSRVTSSEYDLGIIAFYEGSLSHNIPNAALKNKNGFNLCAQLDNNQIVSLMLFGQKNIGASEPFKSVNCDIDFEMDNNRIGNSAYDVFIYCLHSTGKYKLVSQASSYDPLTNKLSLSGNFEIFNAGWFDEIEGT